jgi:hypothetical protein
LGNPLKFVLTPGQRNDITQEKILSEGLRNTTVNADKGYDCNLPKRAGVPAGALAQTGAPDRN